MIEDARSNVVLLATKPSLAFKGFEMEKFAREDFDRSPIPRAVFGVGACFSHKFKGPTSPVGKRLWRKSKHV